MVDLRDFLEDNGYIDAYIPAAYRQATISTTRPPAMSEGKVGEPTAHLSDVGISALVLPSASAQWEIRQAVGLEGSAVQVYELYAAPSTHIDNGVTVTQTPDIREGDRISLDGTTYTVRWAASGAPHSFGEVLIMYLTEDKRR